MAIKFICSCGKRLRAREEMAARRSVCPRCGAPVGIPSLQPTHPGTAARPMTPAERFQARQQRRLGLEPPPTDTSAATTASPITEPSPPPLRQPPAPGSGPTSPLPLDSALVRLVSRPRSRSSIYREHLETHWHECLLYPLGALRRVLALALGLTILTAALALVLPELDELHTVPDWILLLYAPCLVLPLVLIGNVCGWLEGSLRSALAGEVKYVSLPGRDLRLALTSCATWIVCFLAGPSLLVGASLLYWIHCGDPAWLDWLILAELNVLAVAYALRALLAVNQNGQLRDANPERIAQLVPRLGSRGLFPLLVAAVLLPAHGPLVFVALEELHRQVLAGGLLLLLCWSSGLFWAAFLFRWLGVCCYRQLRANGKRRAAADNVASVS